MKGFEGIDFPVCQALGCAKVDSNGQYINDAEEKLGAALSGNLQVYECDQSSFVTRSKWTSSKFTR